VVAVAADDGPSRIVVDPTARELQQARSLHVFAFTSQDDLILNESEGEFTLQEWDQVQEAARRQCCPPITKTDDVDMMSEDRAGADLRNFTRSTMETKIASDLYWK
jgi:exosome complex component RRP46